ncbi:nucleoside/nucleotide kinase family protein [Mycolicibacterium helvum]|uniref:Nucleoside/nucleotide kinase family protein n=1 Tax=Mycolicibacterium helvum TaxID=1534349 RepID=A0A7I7TCI2_9MYCO|nr:nucleoside/nucleotide kinase family protein [Mycolicibacterium helvum]BBY65866.1 nucleoside/nucleotide kinase family protein [Mycolicibacterium helvum]
MTINDSRDSCLDLVVDDVTTLLDRAPGRVVVGITGPPGAGKSTMALAMVASFGGAAYLPMDGFHLSNAALDRLGCRDRKGAIDTFDAAGYLATLVRVAGEFGRRDVYVPAFDRRLDEPIAAGHIVPAASRLVITEGNYLGVPDGDWAAVRPLLNRLYYVDCSPQVRRERLVVRHIDGGRTSEEAQAWVNEVDELNARLIATTRQFCDRVVDRC